MALTVSALAGAVGLSADTVRYYERVGLLPEPARSAAGYRLYDEDAELERLRALEADLNRLLERRPDVSCPEATTAAAASWWCAEELRPPSPARGEEVTAMPADSCPPDCPCRDCPPDCCSTS